MQGVKPTPRLPDVFHDEIAWIVAFEPLAILERVMHLGERHRATLKPAVQNLWHALHHRLTGGVIRVCPHQIVDGRAMQLGDTYAEIALEISDAAVHINARIVGVVATPYGYGRAPEAIAANCPVTGVF